MEVSKTSQIYPKGGRKLTWLGKNGIKEKKKFKLSLKRDLP